MRPRRPSRGSPAHGGLAGLGIAAFAVICCAALPLLAALAGSVGIGTVLGAGAGLGAAVLLVGLVAAHGQRRRAGNPSAATAEPPANGASRRGSTP
jgi:hypothetical protein